MGLELLLNEKPLRGGKTGVRNSAKKKEEG